MNFTQEDVTAFVEILAARKAKEMKRLQEFHEVYQHRNINLFIQKVIEKYASKKYKDSWYNRGIIPPNDLYYFLNDYAILYGREAKKKEYKKYGNRFTESIYFLGDYCIHIMIGQGRSISITPTKDLKKD